MFMICKWILERGIAPDHFELQLAAYYRANKLTGEQYDELVGMLKASMA